MQTNLFLLLFILSSTLAQECRFTVHGGPSGPAKRCVFPFVIRGRTYQTCTTVQEGKRRPWCPTKLDSRRRVDIISNDWGYCNPSCPFDDGTGVLRTTTPKPGQSTTTRRTTPRTFATTRRPTRRPLTTSQAPDRLSSDNGLWLPRKEEGECGYSVARGYIVGGKAAVRGEFPFGVLLGYKNIHKSGPHEVLYRCGGSLINRRYVLTAAHCHDPTFEDNQIVEIVVGEHDVARDPDCPNGCFKVQRFKPEQVILHSGYSLENGASVVVHDIALVRLDGIVDTILENPDLAIMAVCLPPPNSHEIPDEFVVFGWGKSSNDADLNDLLKVGVATRMPQKLVIPSYDRTQCGLIFPGIQETHICAGGEQDRDSCDGDSGGPLVDKVRKNDQMSLYGIVSAGSRHCGAGQPGIYTRIDHYIDWIKDNLRP